MSRETIKKEIDSLRGRILFYFIVFITMIITLFVAAFKDFLLSN